MHYGNLNAIAFASRPWCACTRMAKRIASPFTAMNVNRAYAHRLWPSGSTKEVTASG
jgi:hypothetical protein